MGMNKDDIKESFGSDFSGFAAAMEGLDKMDQSLKSVNDFKEKNEHVYGENAAEPTI